MSEKALNSILMVLAVLTVGVLTLYASSNCGQTELETTATPPARRTAQPVPTATLPPLLPTPFHTAVIVMPLTPEPTRLAISTPALTSEATPQMDGGVYIVQKGDTLYSIARRFGVSPQALAAANNIADPSHILVGQRLIIPSASASPLPASTPSPTTTAIPTPSYEFTLERMENIPNCGLTQIWGYIRDAAGNGLANYPVKVVTADGSWSAVSNPSGANGYYDIVLAPGAKAGRWQVFVVAADGSKLSPVVEVETTATDCLPGGKGVQTPRLDFRRRW